MTRAQKLNLRREVDQAVQKAAPYIEKIARFGIACRGINYLILGGLAVLAAVGLRKRTASTGGILDILMHRHYGWLVLAGLTLGFLAFGLWQILRAARDPEGEGTSWRGIGRRLAFLWSGVINFALVGIAIHVMMIGPSRDVSGDQKARSWAATALQYPLGRWVLGGVGVGMLLFGIGRIWKAWNLNESEDMLATELSKRAKAIISNVGRFGIAARGMVFGLVGIFLMLAAWDQRPDEARGQGGVLTALLRHRHGDVLLSIIAAGLIAYGLYALIVARYRRIRTR